MRHVPALAALVAAATLSGGLAACSSTSDGDPTTGPSTSTSVSSSGAVSTPVETPTGFPSTSASTPSGSGLTTEQATAALLTATEVGGGFTSVPAENDSSPLPCTPNDPPLDQQLPPSARAEAGFSGHAEKAFFSEQVETFEDSDTVAQVLDTAEQGLSCGTATVSGTSVHINGPTDLTSAVQVTVDQAKAWTITADKFRSSLIAVQLGQQLVVFSFTADSSLSSADLPDAEQLVNLALTKVDDAMN